MIRFYSPDIETTGRLPETESAHCCRVLRMRAGDRIEVVDGRGHSFMCEISDANPKGTDLMILEKREEPLHWKPRITLAVAPTKNMDRMEWLAEKAVEIGVSRLVFLSCDRSVRKVVKRDRIEKILVSAMKQSLKATLPEFVEICSFGDYVKEETAACRLMGYCDENIERLDMVQVYDGVSDVAIMVGPEGDFSPQEVCRALEAGFKPVTFGATRLRTETAALYALCAAHVMITQQTLK